MNDEIPQAFWQGVEEFNQHEFYACHDTLEALWMEAMEPTKKFYQSILQIAVGLYHLSNKNWRGAVISMGEGIRRLDYYQPDYSEIDVEQLLTQASELLVELQQAGAENVDNFVPLSEKIGEKLPKINRVAPPNDEAEKLSNHE